MFRLLNASFFRMKKNKVFFTINIITIGIAIAIIINNIPNKALNINIDNLLFYYNYVSGLFIAMFTSLFIGADYDYGTIRNKIIVGHTRKRIYLSNFIFSIISGFVFELIYILVVMVLGKLIIGNLEMPFSEVTFKIIETLFVIVAYASIFNLITMLTDNITFATAICMLLFLAMYITGSILSPIVNCPKYFTETIYDESGNIEGINKEINPNYPSDIKMKISKAIYYAIPTGSAIQISNTNENTDNWILFSELSIVIIMSNGIGIYVFNKKDLK